MKKLERVGVIGGAGWLGRVLVSALIQNGDIDESSLSLSFRSPPPNHLFPQLELDFRKPDPRRSK